MDNIRLCRLAKGILRDGARMAAAIAVVAAAATSSYVSAKEKNDGRIRIVALKGPTAIGVLEMAENGKSGGFANDYSLTVSVGADAAIPMLLKGDTDIAALPINAGAALYARTGGKIRMLAINTLGALKIAQYGASDIKTVSDLKGKTIYATGKGLVPEAVLSMLLSDNGLKLGKDVKVTWMSEPSEIVAKMRVDGSGTAMLPEPFMTSALMQNGDFKVSLNLNDEWKKAFPQEDIVTGAFFAKSEFAESNREAMKDFISDFTKSAESAVSDPGKTAVLAEKNGILKKEIAEKAIGECLITSVSGDAMEKLCGKFVKKLHSFNSSLTGGKLPGRDFWFK